MKGFGFAVVSTAAFIFALLWKKEVDINECLRKNITHKEFAHMDLRGGIIRAMQEEELESMKEVLDNALTEDVANFFEYKYAGDKWRC